MNVVNTNISALRATNASVSAGKMLGTAMERLSTGRRINSAADDAAGLAISASFTSQIRGMAQGIRNANDGISLAQTAEGALDEVTNMLQRMRELTVQRSNGTYSANDIANIDAERNALADQIVQVVNNSTFNGIQLFNQPANTISIQAGARQTDAIDINVPQLNATTGELAAVVNFGPATPIFETRELFTFADPTNADAVGGADARFWRISGNQFMQVDVNNLQDPGVVVTLTDDQLTYLFEGGGSPVPTIFETVRVGEAQTGEALSNNLAAFDLAIGQVTTARADLGAFQNRLQSAVNNLTNVSTNLSDARSRIMDTDYSVETTALAKAQILGQASTAMLAQANQSQQNVLSLLR